MVLRDPLSVKNNDFKVWPPSTRTYLNQNICVQKFPNYYRGNTRERFLVFVFSFSKCPQYGFGCSFLCATLNEFSMDVLRLNWNWQQLVPRASWVTCSLAGRAQRHFALTKALRRASDDWTEKHRYRFESLISPRRLVCANIAHLAHSSFWRTLRRSLW